MPDHEDERRGADSTPLLQAEHSGAVKSLVGAGNAAISDGWHPAEDVATPHAPVLKPGTLLAGRFRLVRALGRGGMGAVFEAEDSLTRERVALKTILPEVARDEQAMGRFRRELQLARKITHPNVCRVNELFEHQQDSDSLTFLTMELLAGQTLAEFLVESSTQEARRLKPSEALPIVRQIVLGLEAAHKVGVVHRDLKPSNVMLVPDREGIRAVVMDFGLARASETSKTSLTGTDDVLGTPLYMAPEQVEGKPVSLATDIYALGAVMFEMVAGRPPFVGETRMAIAVGRLHDEPPSPRSVVPDLDRNWEAVILQCLERRPEDRFHTAGDVVRALDGEIAPPWFSASQRRKARRWTLRIALAVTLAALGLGGRKYWPRGGVDLALPLHPRVAVLGFHNEGPPEDGWIDTALSDLVTRELGAGGLLRVIPVDQVARMQAELQPTITGQPLPTEVLNRIRKNLGVDAVVLGSFKALGDSAGGQMQVTPRVQSALNAAVFAPGPTNGRRAAVFDLGGEVGARLRASLSRGRPTPDEEAEARASMPSSGDAVQLYAEGLARLQHLDPLGARSFLTEAGKADPRSPAIQTALAEAWSQLGYDANALRAAKQASDLSTETVRLARSEQLEIECRYRQLARDWEAAINACRALVSAFPANIEYLLRYATLLREAGRWDKALQAIADAQKVNPAFATDPRVSIEQAWAYGELGKSQEQSAALDGAVSAAVANGATLIEAHAQFLRCMALQRLKAVEARATCERALDLFNATGDLIGIARGRTQLAHLLAAEGKISEAKAAYKDVVGYASKVGSKVDEAQAVLNLGGIEGAGGDLKGALAEFKTAKDIALQSGNELTLGLAERSLGVGFLQTRRVPEARVALEKSVAIFRRLNNQSELAEAEGPLGRLLADEGQLKAARELLEDGFRTASLLKNTRAVAYIGSDLSSVLYELDFQEDASKANIASVAAFRKMQNAADALYGEVQAAQILIAQRRNPEARTLLVRLSNEFEKLSDSDGGAQSAAWLARLALFEKDLPSAGRWSKTAVTLSGKSQDPMTRVVADLSVGWTAIKSGGGKADVYLKRALAEASRGRLIALSLEARYALAQGAGSEGVLAEIGTQLTSMGYIRLSRELTAL